MKASMKQAIKAMEILGGGWVSKNGKNYGLNLYVGEARTTFFHSLESLIYHCNKLARQATI